MIWNLIPNEERLHLWKNLREEMKDLLLEEQLKEVSNFCKSMPIGSRTMDYYTPENWPTPWEILFYGTFCTSSISLIMFYTLDLLEGEKILELLLVEDDEGVYLLPIIDNQFVLNYHLGQVSTYSKISKEFKVLKKYSREEIKKII